MLSATAEQMIAEAEPATQMTDRRPVLTNFDGAPGSGKTNLARRLEADGAGMRICTDDWQEALSSDLADIGIHERLQMILHRRAMAMLEHGVDVIGTAATKGDMVSDINDCRAGVYLMQQELLARLVRRLWMLFQPGPERLFAGGVVRLG